MSDCSSTECLETNLNTSRSSPATDSDNVHSLPWYGQNHSHTTSYHAYLQSQPVRISAADNSMHSHDPFNYTVSGDSTFVSSSDASTTKEKLQQLAPIISPYDSAQSVHLDTCHIPKLPCHGPVANQQHDLSVGANEIILPEISCSIPQSPRCRSSTFDSARLGRLSGHPSKVPGLHGPCRDLLSTVIPHGLVDHPPEFNRKPLPAKRLGGLNDLGQQSALLREPMSGFQNEVNSTSSMNRPSQFQILHDGDADALSVLPSSR